MSFEDYKHRMRISQPVTLFTDEWFEDVKKSKQLELMIQIRNHIQTLDFRHYDKLTIDKEVTTDYNYKHIWKKNNE